jgi:ribonuclease HII
MENYKENKYELGIDEAGRGPFFGPVYAAAVIWGNAPDNELIKDSKKLSKKKRKEAFKWIKENVKAYGVGFCSNEEIDQFGILNATQKAMERAINNIENIPIKKKYSLLIDGTGWNDRDFETNLPKINIESVVKGDGKYRNIAAASILAKESHDQHIDEICSNNEELNFKYDLSNNKGYGTKKHIEGIKKYGLSDFHRHSFNINY